VREPRWVSRVAVLALHTDQIRAHGGALGLRDRGLLESALDRPKRRVRPASEGERPASEGELCHLAAACGLGIARTRPFVDGNLRVAFLAMHLFLGLNGIRIEAREEEVVALMASLSCGHLDEAELADWLRCRTVPR